MKILLDSSAILHYAKGTNLGLKVKQIMEKSENIYCNGIVYCECINTSNIEKINIIKKIFNRIEILPLSITEIIESGELLQNQRREGLQISVTDALIAISAIKTNSTLITTDGDFTRIKQLKQILLQ